MSTPSDTTPEPQREALARIGDILANAEREVADVVAAAESAASDHEARDRSRALAERSAELDARAADLDRRASELVELTAGILSTAAEVQSYARRLSAMPLLSDGAPSPAVADLPPFDPPVRPVAEVPPPAPVALPRDRDAPSAGTTPPSTTAPAALHAVAPDAWGPSASPAPAPHSTPAAPPQAAPTVQDDLPIVAGSETASDPPEKLDSARLIALSMAAEGRSRAEVEAHVRDSLGIVEHAALIDYVFGGSTPASVVPSWPPRRRRRTS